MSRRTQVAFGSSPFSDTVAWTVPSAGAIDDGEPDAGARTDQAGTVAEPSDAGPHDVELAGAVASGSRDTGSDAGDDHRKYSDTFEHVSPSSCLRDGLMPSRECGTLCQRTGRGRVNRLEMPSRYSRPAELPRRALAAAEGHRECRWR